MPAAQFKEGIINSYDPATQMGNYRENNTTTDRDMETLRPEVDVVAGQSVTVMIVTPSGRSVSIAIKIDGKER